MQALCSWIRWNHALKFTVTITIICFVQFACIWSLYFDLNFTTGIKSCIVLEDYYNIYILNDLILASLDYHLQWKVENFSWNREHVFLIYSNLDNILIFQSFLYTPFLIQASIIIHVSRDFSFLKVIQNRNWKECKILCKFMYISSTMRFK